MGADPSTQVPHYFFHVVNGHLLIDRDGVDCATVHEARIEAVRAAGEMLKELGAQPWRVSHWYMFVTDEQNKTLFKLAFEVEDLSAEHEVG